MPRRARLILPDIPLRIIQRGNNRQACFFVDGDYSVYLDWLGEHASKTGRRVCSYVLMTNHVHLLMSADRVEAPGLLMKALGKIRTIMQDVSRGMGNRGLSPVFRLLLQLAGRLVDVELCKLFSVGIGVCKRKNQ